MTIKLEEMMNEFRYPASIQTDKAIGTSSNVTIGGTLSVTGAATFTGAVVAPSQTINGSLTVTGSIAVGNDVTIADALTVTGASTLIGTPTLGATGSAGYTALGAGGPQLISGTLAPPANPTGITAAKGSLFINLTATGVTNRIYINTDGATAWTFLATSGA